MDRILYLVSPFYTFANRSAIEHKKKFPLLKLKTHDDCQVECEELGENGIKK